MNEELQKVKEERDALAAHVERLRTGIRACIESDWAVPAEEALEEALEEGAAASLARLKAQAKAEAFENLSNYAGYWTQADMQAIASDYRRQAEGDK